MTTLAMPLVLPKEPAAARPAGLPANADDAALMRAFQDGRAEAMDRLVARHGASLMGYLAAMTDPEAARDLWQDAWLRVIRNPGGFREGVFRAWLFTIARNLVIDRHRRRGPDASLDAPIAGMDGLTLADCIPASMRTPADERELDDLRERAASCVRALPPDQREVFLWRVQTEMSFAEIAARLRVPLNTALGRMHYAVAKLRKMLEENT